MHRTTGRELITYLFDCLPAERLVHAVFTRLGGVSQPPFATLNVGSSVGDDPAAVAENHARIYQLLEISADRVASGHQVHSNHVAVVTDQDGGRVFSRSDALVTDCPGLGLMLRFADCQPVLVYDPARHAVALVHAGWRGLAQGITHRAVEAMERAFGSRPCDLIAALGPAIGPCCYVVGDNVAAAMGYALPRWRQAMRREGSSWRFDLPAANAQQLEAAGVTQIEQAGLCTSCRCDEFYSHRAENGHTGRFAVLVYLRGGAAHSLDRPQAPVVTEHVESRSDGPESLHPSGLPGFGDAPSGPVHAEDPSGECPAGHTRPPDPSRRAVRPGDGSERQS